MPYSPVTAVWEITFACNMRCKHCGSKCSEAAPDELSEAESLDLCDQIGAMKLQYVTLSGGEPFMRPDWWKIAQRLKQRGVIPNILSNGWFIDEKIVARAVAVGVSNIGLSIDGLRESHDFMRRPGSFDRIMQAYDLMRSVGLAASAITSINKRNLPELPALRQLLIEHGVYNWQIQVAMPMGHLAAHPELVIEPEDIESIIDFAYETMQQGGIEIDLSDCLGYYSEKDVAVRKASIHQDSYSGLWGGCPAGKYSFGIRCNGDITGCNSLRDTTGDFYREGNIRQTLLRELWTRPGAFSWNRDLIKEKLEGFCQCCLYGHYCLGGCSSMKQSMGRTLGRNDYCLYHLAVKREADKIATITDFESLLENGRQALQNDEPQLAELYLARGNALHADHQELLELLGLAHFKLGNFQLSREWNERLLQRYPQSAYGHKGLGLCWHQLGQSETGIGLLRQAIALEPGFLDAYYDLALVLSAANRYQEALDTLMQGQRQSENFAQHTAEFAQQLRERLAPSKRSVGLE
jgi:radical SAM protein with 4Fe4S-binding SPASM domain